ncbi:MAG TPA: VWA domain-containing protein, partial [Thermoanaerobaculia bacterium]
MKIASSLLAVLLVCSLGLAQTPYFETFEVRLHNLEVVVTDPKDNPVRGLTKDDFIVIESGKAQTITNFSVYDGGTAAASSVNPEAPQEAQPVAEAAPVQSPRRFIFFVDDMAVRAVARKPLIRNAVALVDQLQPGDLATVVRPTGANRVALPFTSDHAAVRTALTKAIESCVLNFSSPGQGEVEQFVNAMENARSAKERKFARSEYITRSRQRIQQRLAQLRAVIGSTAGLDGRKVLVLITSGLSAQPGRESIPPIEQMRMGLDDGEKELQAAERAEAALFQDDVPQGDVTMQEQASTAEFVPAPNLNPLIDELGRAAAANGVTIYALEPEVPLDLSARKTTAGSRTVGSLQSSSFVGGATIVQSVMYDEMQHYRGQTLTSLTEKTGGKWFRGTSSIDDVFHQIASDMSVYYSLAYRAT